jgi:hypothetical protein
LWDWTQRSSLKIQEYGCRAIVFNGFDYGTAYGDGPRTINRVDQRFFTAFNTG